MSTALAARIPLVCSHRPPGAPLGERVAYLTAQARQPDGASHRDNVASAAGILNFAALIASDSGIPELTAALCWRQHEIFASAGALAPDISVIALMPLVNIARQQAPPRSWPPTTASAPGSSTAARSRSCPCWNKATTAKPPP